MWLVFCVIIFSTFEKNTAFYFQNKLLDSLAEQIKQNIKPHQLTFWLNNTVPVTKCKYENVLQKLVLDSSSVIVDFTDFQSSQANRSLRIPRYENPNSVLNVIVQCAINNNAKDVLSNIKGYFKFFKQLHPGAVRPRCLFILLSNENLDQDVRTIFEYTWKYKFLGFSILQLPSNSLTSVLYHFNPFFNTVTKDTGNSSIFPDKLGDCNGYPLRFPIFKMPPHVDVTWNKKGEIVQISGVHYHVTQMLVEYMNFTPRVEKFFEVKESLGVVLSSVLESMYMGEVDMLIIPLPRPEDDLLYADKILELDTGLIYEDLVALVPVLDARKSTHSTGFFIFIFLGPLVTVIVTGLAKRLCKVNWVSLTALDIWGLLFGAAIVRRPETIIDRLVMFSIFVTHLRYSTVFYSEFTKVKLSHDQVPFDTFHDISKSPFPLYITDILYERTFNSYDDDMKRISRKTFNMQSMRDCENMLSAFRNVICLESKSRATNTMTKHRHSEAEPIIKIAKPVFHSIRLVYIFAGGSPYREKVNIVLKRIYEAGLFDFEVRDNRKDKHSNYDSIESISHTIIFISLLSILVSGCLVASIIFVMELIVSRYYT